MVEFMDRVVVIDTETTGLSPTEGGVMFVEILRIYNNYVMTDSKKLKNKGSSKKPLTPAQKLGLADKQYSIQDILSFSAFKEFKEGR